MYTKFMNYTINNVTVTKYRYTNAIAIQLENRTEGPIATATVNIPDTTTSIDEIIVDTNNCGNEIIDWLYDNKFIISKTPTRWTHSGYCSYPIFKVDMAVIYSNMC